MPSLRNELSKTFFDGIVVKWKQSGKVDFFRKKSKDTVRCSFWFWVEWWYFRLSSHWVVTYDKLKISQKKFCVGCKCYTNLKFSNRHNSPPNGARESKIPPCDSESRTLSTCILRFFSKKIDLPTLFSFYQSHYLRGSCASEESRLGLLCPHECA